MTSTLHAMDHRGDTRVEWDPARPVEVTAARETFDRLRREGYMAYTVEDDERGAQIHKFDPDAERIIMHRALAGG
jgi:hypothetical protein